MDSAMITPPIPIQAPRWAWGSGGLQDDMGPGLCASQSRVEASTQQVVPSPFRLTSLSQTAFLPSFREGMLASTSRLPEEVTWVASLPSLGPAI